MYVLPTLFVTSLAGTTGNKQAIIVYNNRVHCFFRTCPKLKRKVCVETTKLVSITRMLKTHTKKNGFEYAEPRQSPRRASLCIIGLG